MKRSVLSEEERLSKRAAYDRAWRARNAEKLRERRLDNRDKLRERLRQRAALQRQALVDAGFALPLPGRPRKDPDAVVVRPKQQKREGEAYRAYQREYHRTFRAKRREAGWKTAACGPVPPEFASVIAARADGDARSFDENPNAKFCSV